jgi:hypothetical protein
MVNDPALRRETNGVALDRGHAMLNKRPLGMILGRKSFIKEALGREMLTINASLASACNFVYIIYCDPYRMKLQGKPSQRRSRIPVKTHCAPIEAEGYTKEGVSRP